MKPGTVLTATLVFLLSTHEAMSEEPHELWLKQTVGAWDVQMQRLEDGQWVEWQTATHTNRLAAGGTASVGETAWSDGGGLSATLSGWDRVKKVMTYRSFGSQGGTYLIEFTELSKDKRSGNVVLSRSTGAAKGRVTHYFKSEDRWESHHEITEPDGSVSKGRWIFSRKK